MSKALEDMRNEVVGSATIAAHTKAIKNLMEYFKIDAERAMDVLKIPVSERPMYGARL